MCFVPSRNGKYRNNKQRNRNNKKVSTDNSITEEWNFWNKEISIDGLNSWIDMTGERIMILNENYLRYKVRKKLK